MKGCHRGHACSPPLGRSTFALVRVEALLITLRSPGSVVCRFRQAM
jgi:hypothetical protein